MGFFPSVWTLNFYGLLANFDLWDVSSSVKRTGEKMEEIKLEKKMSWKSRGFDSAPKSLISQNLKLFDQLLCFGYRIRVELMVCSLDSLPSPPATSLFIVNRCTLSPKNRFTMKNCCFDNDSWISSVIFDLQMSNRGEKIDSLLNWVWRREKK